MRGHASPPERCRASTCSRRARSSPTFACGPSTRTAPSRSRTSAWPRVLGLPATTRIVTSDALGRAGDGARRRRARRSGDRAARRTAGRARGTRCGRAPASAKRGAKCAVGGRLRERGQRSAGGAARLHGPVRRRAARRLAPLRWRRDCRAHCCGAQTRSRKRRPSTIELRARAELDVREALRRSYKPPRERVAAARDLAAVRRRRRSASQRFATADRSARSSSCATR